MFVRPITSAELAVKDIMPSLIPQLQQEDITDGLYFQEAKLISCGSKLYNYNRKVMTTDMPRHSLGYEFAKDRTIEAINPATAIPNPMTPPEILSRVAMPDQPPKMFGM